MLITRSNEPNKALPIFTKSYSKEIKLKKLQTIIQQIKNLQNQVYFNTPTLPNTHIKQWKAQSFTFKIQFCYVSKKTKLKTERETERAVNNLKCSKVLTEKNNVRNHKWFGVLSAGKWFCRGGCLVLKKTKQIER